MQPPFGSAASQPPGAPRPLSPAQAVGEAVDLVRQRLFPFRFDRWLRLGFVAFLDSCGRGSSGARFPGGAPGSSGSTGSTSGGGGAGPDVDKAVGWIAGHVALLGTIALGVLVLVVALSALVTWLHSRGVFMYLDDVATGRDDIARPWREHRVAAHSYFVWRFGLSLVTLCGVLALLVPGIFFGWSLLRHGVSVGPIVGIVALFGLLIVLVLLSGLFGVLLRDFAAPLQLVLRVPCGRATGVAWGLVKRNPGAFVLYLLLKILLSIVAAFLNLFAGCCTCCLGFIPVVNQTLLQPLYYFERAWSLLLLRQAGFDLFAAMTMTAIPPSSPPALGGTA